MQKKTTGRITTGPATDSYSHPRATCTDFIVVFDSSLYSSLSVSGKLFFFTVAVPR